MVRINNLDETPSDQQLVLGFNFIATFMTFIGGVWDREK